MNCEIIISNIFFRFTGHSSSVNDVCFAPAGNLMASCSLDGSLAVWIPNITGESTFWKGHQAAARSVAFTPDGRQILSASDDKTIKLWNVHKSKYVKQILHCWKCQKTTFILKIIILGL
jgi:centriolar protein POC1